MKCMMSPFEPSSSLDERLYISPVIVIEERGMSQSSQCNETARRIREGNGIVDYGHGTM